MIEPNITIDMPKAPRLAKVKMHEEKSRSGNTGSGARNSIRTKATSTSCPPISRPRMSGESQGKLVPPRDTASSVAVMPTDIVAMPQ